VVCAVNYAMLRAPIQIAITDTGGPQGPGVLAFNAYLRVQNGTTLAIQSNSGSLYSTISALTIPNVADGQYHEWTTQILVREGMAYWDLRLDGTQLLFGGTDGSPVLEARQYSFRTGPNSFSGNPYIGLGELQSGAANGWDFEFDYVRFQNLPEPATLVFLGAGALGLIRRRRQRP